MNLLMIILLGTAFAGEKSVFALQCRAEFTVLEVALNTDIDIENRLKAKKSEVETLERLGDENKVSINEAMKDVNSCTD